MDLLLGVISKTELNYTLEHILISTLVTVFTVRVGEHNFNVIIIILCPAPGKLTFDLLTLKLVSESSVTWPTSAPIVVFLGLSVLDLVPMYATERQTSDVRCPSSINTPTLEAGHNNNNNNNNNNSNNVRLFRHFNVY